MRLIPQELRRLKIVCNEMELNTQDLESLVEEYEAKESATLKEKYDLAELGL